MLGDDRFSISDILCLLKGDIDTVCWYYGLLPFNNIYTTRPPGILTIKLLLFKIHTPFENLECLGIGRMWVRRADF